MPEGLVASSCRGSAAKDLVIRLIAEKGPLPFSSFMEAALYSPEGGYYTSGGETWGPRGDYITSLDVSPVFARTLARQVIECWELLGSPSSFGCLVIPAQRAMQHLRLARVWQRLPVSRKLADEEELGILKALMAVADFLEKKDGKKN